MGAYSNEYDILVDRGITEFITLMRYCALHTLHKVKMLSFSTIDMASKSKEGKQATLFKFHFKRTVKQKGNFVDVKGGEKDLRTEVV